MESLIDGTSHIILRNFWEFINFLFLQILIN